MIPIISFSNIPNLTPLYYLQPSQYSQLPGPFSQVQLPMKIEKNLYQCQSEEIQKIIDQLKKSKIYEKKKHWTITQDQILINSVQIESLTWKQVSEKIENTNQKICQRRYFRLKQNQKLWSRQEQQKIKYMKQVEKKKWKQISQIIKKHSSKQIRQRYINFIRSNIVQKPWILQQDMIILKGVKQNGRKWKILQGKLQGRSQNQIKNRYYGTLTFIQKKVKKRMRKTKKNKENWAY